MKTFLLQGKIPICKWSLIPDETYFEGNLPQGFGLATCPHDPYIIIDIDNHGNMIGMDNIPENLKEEIFLSLGYNTKSGYHAWFKYSGDKPLMNKTSKKGIDLRTSKGYVKWYLDKDIRSYIHLIKESSKELNEFLESLFLGVNYEKEITE